MEDDNEVSALGCFRVSVRLTPQDEKRVSMLQSAGLPEGAKPRTRATVMRTALVWYANQVKREAAG